MLNECCRYIEIILHHHTIESAIPRYYACGACCSMPWADVWRAGILLVANHSGSPPAVSPSVMPQPRRRTSYHRAGLDQMLFMFPFFFYFSTVLRS